MDTAGEQQFIYLACSVYVHALESFYGPWNEMKILEDDSFELLQKFSIEWGKWQSRVASLFKEDLES